MTLADDIRSFAATNYVEPARKSGRAKVTIVAGDVHAAMGLKSRVPAVCSALRARAFEVECGVALEGSSGPHQSTTTQLSFRLVDDPHLTSSEQRLATQRPEKLRSQVASKRIVTADELARWRRQVVRLLDDLEVNRDREASPRFRITRLSRDGIIPRETASLMITITEMRNAAEYNRKVLSQAESDAIRGAWGAVSEWARERGIQIEN